MNPDLAGAWSNKGVTLSNLGREEEALTAYERALEIDPNNAATWNNKGVTLSNLGREEEALVAYERAIAINPDFAKARATQLAASHTGDGADLLSAAVAGDLTQVRALLEKGTDINYQDEGGITALMAASARSR